MKKVGYVFLLIVVILGIIGFFVVQNQFGGNKNNSSSQIAGMRSTNEVDNNTSKNETTKNETTSDKKSGEKKTQVTELDDGTLYSFNGKQEKAEIVIGDNYFDTQINDIMLNYNEYKGKTVEIEGMYIDVYSPYTVVGRYSTNNLCAYCPVGYSAFEYIWKGEKINAVNEETWLKIIGTFSVGNDESSNFRDYYYIDVSSIEVMNESGLKTVSN